MSVYYVYQGKTYKKERAGSYVWPPKRTKNGKRNAGYEMMTHIKKGDFILHNSSGKIMAISIAETDCQDGERPEELTNKDWASDGYLIDTQYVDINPLVVKNHWEWLKEHHKKRSAFSVEGKAKEQYMCALDEEHAIYLLKEALKLQTSNEVKETLKKAIAAVVEYKDSEYDQLEKDAIESLIDNTSEKKPEWTGRKEKQAMTTASSSEGEKPKRNPQIAADALARAEYVCEFNKDDRTFKRKNGKAYTEPHHLIPISKYRDFEYSVDVMENVVSLCSHCHNLLHYGRIEDKIPVLEKLYKERKKALAKVGLKITLKQLEEYYK